LADNVCNAIYCSHYRLQEVDESLQILVAAVNIGIHIANENILGLSCEEGEECHASLIEAMQKLNMDETMLEQLSEDFNEVIA
jgi:hypothetical protein